MAPVLHFYRFSPMFKSFSSPLALFSTSIFNTTDPYCCPNYANTAGGVLFLPNNPSGQGCRRYLFAKVGRERVHEPQGLSTSAKKVRAVDFCFPLPPWQKDISGSLVACWRQLINSYPVCLNPNLD
ncbi:hypothetical protein JW933_00220 [candidate division FCPU426 bacterium]|nr:hypothetical protein [candidate division FCPU426 bacterium]